jgi:hypothetical protein
MSQGRRAAATRMPRITTSGPERIPEPEQTPVPTARVVIVDTVDGVWRVSAAHMEPLRFRDAAEAEKIGHRVAQTLIRLGFDARVDTYDAAGALAATKAYSARVGGPPPARRQLNS